MRFVALLAAAVLVASACGGSDTTEAGSESSPSPIAEFLGQPDFFSDEEAAREQIVAQERARQELIAECMQKQGFEYVPVDPSETIFFGDGDEEYGSEEWTAKYGFGITTQWFSQDQVGPDLLGYDDSGFFGGDGEDPNGEIVQALSESERDAYYEALHGDDFFAFDETLSEDEIEAQLEDFEFTGPGGCEGEAWNADPATRFYQDFQDELQALDEQVEADPRIAEAEQELASCVAERGFEYTDMDDLFMRWEPDLQEIESTLDYSGFPELSEDELSEMSPEELDELYRPPELSEEAKGKLAAIQTEEIELAVAVQECGGGFEAQFELLAEVRAEYEQQFLDDNADRLADYAG